MIPKELIKKIKYIDIVTNRIVDDMLAGKYHSVFKGQGIEFSEVREYQVGDDIRSIDWNVFARMGHPYIKKFVEERELTVVLVVDISGSMHFGTKEKFKSEVAAEIAALFSFSAIRNSDKVGLLLFSDKVEKYIPPKKAKTHVLSLIRDVLYFKTEEKKTDFNIVFRYLDNVLKKKSVVIVISDFMFEDYEKSLKIANQKHDVIPVILSDPMEERFPDIGYVEIEDAEKGETLLINTKDVGRHYSEEKKKFKSKQKKFFISNNIDAIEIETDKDYIKPIMKYFKKREKKR